ncbi:ubiquitin 3 binding protein But2 C-terminal domain-containing protein [Xylariaceae sp. FL0255]|nr:ubiquitin 3 binding protein But2 C-terminal domain-containing protein [Xylariaceae sp. FL0255]
MTTLLFSALCWLWWLSSQVVEAQVGCAFHLSCLGGNGSYNGSIGEKTSGQARGGSGTQPTMFTWFGDAFADSSGHGCWWTPPTYTLQCDTNQPPDHGFGIGACNGSLSFQGQSVFYECSTGNGDEVNIYLRPVSSTACHEISIVADNCAPPCPSGGGGVGPGSSVVGSSSMPGAPPSSSSSASSIFTVTLSIPTTLSTSSTAITTSTSTSTSSTSGPVTPTPFTTGTTGTSLQTVTTSTSTSTITLTTTFTPVQPSPTTAPSGSSTPSCTALPPAQIILTDKANPDTSYGANPGMNIQVTPNASSIFNFDFMDADEGRSCELFFLLPPQNSGSGGGDIYNLTGTTGLLTIATLDGWADPATTYSSMPRIEWPLGNVMLSAAGLAQSLGKFECPGSTARTSILLTEGPMADTCFAVMQGGVGDGRGVYLNIC